MDIDLTGAIDLHVHTAPDVYERRLDDIELAQSAKAVGMKALLLKSHHTLTADRAALAAKQTGMTVFGGVVLNHTVGGFNPVAVDTAIAFGAKQVWMPTIHAKHCLDNAEVQMVQAERDKGRQGISVFGDDGGLLPGLPEILEQVRDAGIVLGTGHLGPQESLKLLRIARDMGIKRMLVTHPMMSFTRFTHEQMGIAAELGATLEFDFLSCSPKWPRAVDPTLTAQAIQSVGPKHCVMGTDGGQAYNPPPPEMLLTFAERMVEHGLGRDDLKRMMCDNTARLLDV